MQRQASLADSAHAEQCQQSRICENFLHFGQFTFAADKRRQLEWQVVRRCFQRGQRREILAELRVHELVDVLGARQIAETQRAQIAQRDARGQTLVNQNRHGL